ncbi:uncharacterized protein LOC126745315 [Anthonomus grandis grandis]|uniref:uncharacterized protein LOC126745315 n=1 Tax=Anthonomus grandis grandis TaxID=2921223 RepID=UPI0021650795|nr:uncharacterized protein LOC126745315 [Anthonomus grandis grandis]
MQKVTNHESGLYVGKAARWSDYERAYFMQAKLQGGARAWHNRLDQFDLTWEEWKAKLIQAFPREHDFARLLREMMGRVFVEDRQGESSKVVRQAARAASTAIRCYNCQEFGTHLSKNCPKPKAERCHVCSGVGQDKYHCPRKDGANRVGASGTQVNKAGPKKFQNIIRRDIPDTLGDLAITPTLVTLKGFAGGVTVKGEVVIPVVIDGVELVVKALIADCDLSGADLLLGQPALAIPDVQLTVQGGKAVLSRIETVQEFISRITLVDDDLIAKITKRVLALQDLVVQPGESADILVVVEGAHMGERCWIPARRYENGGAIVATGNHMLDGGTSGVVRVSNVGTCAVKWATGQVIARATMVGPTLLMKQSRNGRLLQ